MHRILLREVVIDVPADVFDDTRDFWAKTLDTRTQLVQEFPEFTAMNEPASMSWVGLQNVGEAPARLHLDIETDDVEAEVARLTRLGAVKVTHGRTWVVMQDPAGLLFDVVPYESPWFEEHARTVS